MQGWSGPVFEYIILTLHPHEKTCQLNNSIAKGSYWFFVYVFLLLLLYTEMAGHFATSVNAKKLVLTHFSQRYKRISDTVPTNVEEDGTVSKLVEQAKKSFSGCIIAADDFVVLRLSLKV